MGTALSGRVAVITGAGRGVGREHALLFAAEGARVVVNDLGGDPDGTGADRSAAQQVVDEIIANGGEAVADHGDVADFDDAGNLIQTAIDNFGGLDILVNNAGILRDRTIVNMSPDEWDAIMRVHLRGHFCPTRHAAAHWRAESKAGKEVKASIINTSSTSGLMHNPGQSNYAAAKSGIASFTITVARELGRYGVRANAIAPAAATRLTEGLNVASTPEGAPEGWDAAAPANISPFVAYLATAECPINARVFFVRGGQICLFQPWAIVDSLDKPGPWTVEELQDKAARFQDVKFNIGRLD